MAKLSPIEQIEKFLDADWQHFFGAVATPHWAELLESKDPALLCNAIEDTFDALKKGKLGKAHALVTYNKILLSDQRELLRQYAAMVVSHQQDVKEEV